MLATARQRLAALKARGLFTGDRWIEVIWEAV